MPTVSGQKAVPLSQQEFDAMCHRQGKKITVVNNSQSGGSIIHIAEGFMSVDDGQYFTTVTTNAKPAGKVYPVLSQPATAKPNNSHPLSVVSLPQGTSQQAPLSSNAACQPFNRLSIKRPAGSDSIPQGKRMKASYPQRVLGDLHNQCEEVTYTLSEPPMKNIPSVIPILNLTEGLNEASGFSSPSAGSESVISCNIPNSRSQLNTPTLQDVTVGDVFQCTVVNSPTSLQMPQQLRQTNSPVLLIAKGDNQISLGAKSDSSIPGSILGISPLLPGNNLHVTPTSGKPRLVRENIVPTKKANLLTTLSKPPQMEQQPQQLPVIRVPSRVAAPSTPSNRCPQRPRCEGTSLESGVFTVEANNRTPTQNAPQAPQQQQIATTNTFFQPTPDALAENNQVTLNNLGSLRYTANSAFSQVDGQNSQMIARRLPL